VGHGSWGHVGHKIPPIVSYHNAHFIDVRLTIYCVRYKTDKCITLAFGNRKGHIAGIRSAERAGPVPEILLPVAVLSQQNWGCNPPKPWCFWQATRLLLMNYHKHGHRRRTPNWGRGCKAKKIASILRPTSGHFLWPDRQTDLPESELKTRSCTFCCTGHQPSQDWSLFKMRPKMHQVAHCTDFAPISLFSQIFRRWHSGPS